jgi:6-phosphogluconolactonase
MTNRHFALTLLLSVPWIGWAAAASLGAERGKAERSAGQLRVYFGTYTSRNSKGIYLGRLDLASGKLELEGVAAETVNPSFLALHPTRPLLYAVGEMSQSDGTTQRGLSAFAIDPSSGKLTLLNQQSSWGTGPCHLTVDRTGRCLLVANYGSGSVACLPIRDDGRLGEATSHHQHRGSSVDSGRQEGPHAHSVNLDAGNRFAFVADLGVDKIFVYRFDAEQGRLTANDPAAVDLAPGSGPRHFAFHPGGRYAYLIQELSSTVTALGYDPARGILRPIQTVSTLPEGFTGSNTTAEVQVHPSGKFVYGSNRGHNSIAAFAVEEATGKLRPIGHTSTRGKTPRNFAIDPTGAWLLAANQDTNNVTVLRIDPKTGTLRPTGQSVSVPMPVCVKIVPPSR